jgi:hypothetical protein
MVWWDRKAELQGRRRVPPTASGRKAACWNVVPVDILAKQSNNCITCFIQNGRVVNVWRERLAEHGGQRRTAVPHPHGTSFASLIPRNKGYKQQSL